MRFFLLALAISVVGCAPMSSAPDVWKIDNVENYVATLTKHISRHWVRPKPSVKSINCEVKITQDSNGVVQTVEITECNGSEEDVIAIKQAVESSSPLPLPDDPGLFDPVIRLIFCPGC